MTTPLRRPSGRPLAWSEVQALAQAIPGPVDRQAAAQLWDRWVPAKFKDLLGAKPKEKP